MVQLPLASDWTAAMRELDEFESLQPGAQKLLLPPRRRSQAKSLKPLSPLSPTRCTSTPRKPMTPGTRIPTLPPRSLDPSQPPFPVPTAPLPQTPPAARLASLNVPLQPTSPQHRDPPELKSRFPAPPLPPSVRVPLPRGLLSHPLLQRHLTLAHQAVNDGGVVVCFQFTPSLLAPLPALGQMVPCEPLIRRQVDMFLEDVRRTGAKRHVRVVEGFLQVLCAVASYMLWKHAVAVSEKLGGEYAKGVEEEAVERLDILREEIRVAGHWEVFEEYADYFPPGWVYW